MAIRIGALRNLVSIQAETTTIDPTTGKRTVTWATVEQAWASIDPVDRREAWQYSQVEIRATHHVIMRYTSTLTLKHRLLWGSRVLQISKIRIPREIGEVLEIVAWELPAP